jgi:hypothetical protein
MAKAAAATPAPLPIAHGRALRPPTALNCLRCQLIGRRKLLCAREDECKAVPHVFALGPFLLLGWLGLGLAFAYAIS